MSRTFRITNKKSFWGFGKTKVMQINEIVSLIDGLIVYYGPDDPNEFNRFLLTPLDKFECIQVGIEGKSSRTFDVFYNKDKDTYNVQVFTPSTTIDWQIAIEFIQNLAKKLKAKIFDEENIEYLSYNITYDYKKDILTGINSLLHHKEEAFNMLFGVHYPFCMSKEQLNAIENSEDKISVFDELFYNHQYINAHFADQKFFKKDDEIIAAYSLTHDTPTILPYVVGVEFHNMHIVSEQEINRWMLFLSTFEDKNNIETYSELGWIEHSKFIEKLPKHKYQHIDGKYILIEELTKEELTDLLK